MSQKDSVTVMRFKFDPEKNDFDIILENNNSSSRARNSNNHLNFQNEFQKNALKSSLPTGTSAPSGNSTLKPKPIVLNSLSTVRTMEARRDILHTCITCKKTYKSKAVYTKHIMQCSPDSLPPGCLLDRTRCFCCEEPLINRHEGTISCRQCSKSFRSAGGLTRHVMLLHSKSVNFKCELCNAQCANRYILSLHRYSHNEDVDRLTKNCPEYKCTHCNRLFLEKTAFDIHIDAHKRNNIKADATYRCRLCGTEMYSLTDFEAHDCKSSKKAKYKCNLCGKNLSSLGFYRRHVNTHKKYNGNTTSIVSTNSDLEDGDVDSADEKPTSILRQMSMIDTSKTPILILNGTESKPLHLRNGETNSVEISGLQEKKSLKQAIQNAIEEDKHNDKREGEDQCSTKDTGSCSLYKMNDNTLKRVADRLLRTLLGNDILQQFGWPLEPIQNVLVDVLKYCDIKPFESLELVTQLRENIKNLVAALTNNSFASDEAVDAVIQNILESNN